MGANLSLGSVPGIFDTLHHVGLKYVSFLKQFVDAL